jgi:CheY-like chemotaxis protein
LIADDNAVNQSLLGLQFEKLGYHPDIVSNGLEVLAQLDHQWYDIVFMDIQMPELNGLETTKQIVKKFGNNRHPIIIAMTGYAGDEDRKKSIDAGMNDYLVKPIKMDDIISAIKKWSPNTKKDIELLIDKEAILRIKSMSGDDEEFTKKLLSMYNEQSAENIIEITNFQKSGNLELLRQSAHKLKGSSLNIGAKAVALICQEIEHSADINSRADLEGLVRSLEPLFEETKRYLHELYH